MVSQRGNTCIEQYAYAGGAYPEPESFLPTGRRESEKCSQSPTGLPLLPDASASLSSGLSRGRTCSLHPRLSQTQSKVEAWARLSPGSHLPARSLHACVLAPTRNPQAVKQPGHGLYFVLGSESGKQLESRSHHPAVTGQVPGCL